MTVHPVQQVQCSLHPAADCTPCADCPPLLTLHPVQQVQYSLRSLLSWLEVPDVNKLHNAGNDARWATSLSRSKSVGQGRLWTAGGPRQRAGLRALQGIVWQAKQRWHSRAGAQAHLTSRLCPCIFACDVSLMCCRYTLEALRCMCPHGVPHHLRLISGCCDH